VKNTTTHQSDTVLGACLPIGSDLAGRFWLWAGFIYVIAGFFSILAVVEYPFGLQRKGTRPGAAELYQYTITKGLPFDRLSL
jgi:hypothetical protein